MELNELRKTAENAHSVLPEPWIVMGDSNTVSVVELSKRDGSIISGGAVADAHTTPFRDHIAAFDPPTVLALLSRLEQAEQAVQRVREVAAECRPSIPEEVLHEVMKDILEALDGDPRADDIDRLRSQVDASILRAALVAIQELHKPCKTFSGKEVCDVCNTETGKPVSYPCNTRRLADDALGGDNNG